MTLLKIDVRKFPNGKVSKSAEIRNRYNQSLHTYLLCEFSGDWDNTTRASYIVVIFRGTPYGFSHETAIVNSLNKH